MNVTELLDEALGIPCQHLLYSNFAEVNVNCHMVIVLTLKITENSIIFVWWSLHIHFILTIHNGVFYCKIDLAIKLN